MEPLVFDWIVKKNFAQADFWLIDKGSAESLGQPVKDFRDCLVGVKVPAILLQEYGFYLCLHLYHQGLWKQFAQGSLNLKHLRITEIRQVFKEMSSQYRQQKQIILVK